MLCKGKIAPYRNSSWGVKFTGFSYKSSKKQDIKNLFVYTGSCDRVLLPGVDCGRVVKIAFSPNLKRKIREMPVLVNHAAHGGRGWRHQPPGSVVLLAAAECDIWQGALRSISQHVAASPSSSFRLAPTSSLSFFPQR